jgi:hypothetical protein
MNAAQHNQGVADAILRAVHKQKPQAATRQRREDIPHSLLAQIKAEATRPERKRLLASERSCNLLARAFQARKPQFSQR